jgi:hypothetical protein
VAFLQPAASNGKGADNADAEPQWILAEVTRCLNAEKNRLESLRSGSHAPDQSHSHRFRVLSRYEVQDADEQEEGESRMYNALLLNLYHFI